MSFVTIAVGTTRRSRVRTLSVRALWAGGMLAASALLVTGAGIGLGLTRLVSTTAAADGATLAPAPITVEQLGAMSARLVMLERQAGQLRERLGLSATPPAAAPVPRAASERTADDAREERADVRAGRGGPMRPPRVDLEALGALDEAADADALLAIEPRLTELQQQIDLLADAALLHGLAQMRLPTRLPIEEGELVSSFGNRIDPLNGRRAFHEGLDFSARPGTPIRAAAGGAVTFAGFRPDFGWTVEIDHGNALVTRYAHASKLYVRSGEIVTPGDRIAAVGSTGRSTGPHLHFEVLRRGSAVDPRRYLAGR
jgi:murein DD-endopeptidase MepM/ murein hydrolase activator NlpD